MALTEQDCMNYRVVISDWALNELTSLNLPYSEITDALLSDFVLFTFHFFNSLGMAIQNHFYPASIIAVLLGM